MDILGALRRKWAKLHRHRWAAPLTPRWRVHGDALASVLDAPEDLPRSRATVVAKGGQPQWLIFDCPCRRGHRVVLNLDTSKRPVWRVRDSARLTVSPSVDETTGHGRCHYIFSEGRVRWV